MQSWAYASCHDRLDSTDAALALNLTIDLKDYLYSLHLIELKVQWYYGFFSPELKINNEQIFSMTGIFLYFKLIFQ